MLVEVPGDRPAASLEPVAFAVRHDEQLACIWRRREPHGVCSDLQPMVIPNGRHAPSFPIRCIVQDVLTKVRFPVLLSQGRLWQ